MESLGSRLRFATLGTSLLTIHEIEGLAIPERVCVHQVSGEARLQQSGQQSWLMTVKVDTGFPMPV